jgi:gliding motility-associated-like protein
MAKHLFRNPGTYQVSLYVDGGCEADSVIKKIMVDAYPVPSMSITPEDPSAGQQVRFDYTGTAAHGYSWDFGDGSISTAKNAEHVFQHEDTLQVKLQAKSPEGCAASVSQDIIVLKAPSVYIPNAFTPDDDGLNDRFIIQGRGMDAIDLQIFDRWGHLVYATNDVEEAMSNGWDGRDAWNPMKDRSSVYRYAIRIVFADGRIFRKSGSITAIR